MNRDLERKKNMTKNTDHFICKYLLICMKFLQLTKSNSYSSLSVIEFMIPTPHLLGEVNIEELKIQFYEAINHVQVHLFRLYRMLTVNRATILITTHITRSVFAQPFCIIQYCMKNLFLLVYNFTFAENRKCN